MNDRYNLWKSNTKKIFFIVYKLWNWRTVSELLKILIFISKFIDGEHLDDIYDKVQISCRRLTKGGLTSNLWVTFWFTNLTLRNLQLNILSIKGKVSVFHNKWPIVECWWLICIPIQLLSIIGAKIMVFTIRTNRDQN